MEEPYLRVIAKTGSAISDLYGATSLLSRTHDPFLHLSALAFDIRGTISRNATTLDYSTPRTAVKNKLSYFDNLALFFEVLNQGAITSAYGRSNWHPRQRFAVSGISYVGYSLSNYPISIVKTYVGNDDFNSVKVDLYSHATLGKFISADELFDYTQRIYETLGAVFTIEHNSGSGSSARHHILHFVVKVSTHESFEYTLLRDVTNTVGVTWSRMFYRVNISRHPLYPFLIVVTMSEGYIVNITHAFTESGARSSSSTNGRYPQRGWIEEEPGNSSLIYPFIKSTRVSIVACTPALYHTQSRAITSLLGNVHRNFETLFETPGFLGGLYKIAVDPPREISKFLDKRLPIWARLREVARLALSVHLLNIFAVQPFLQSSSDTLRSFADKLSGLVHEGELSFTGEEPDFDSLPSKLRDLVRSFDDEGTNPVRYHIVFRTQLELKLNNDGIIRMMSSLFEQASKYGFVPEPRYIWAAQPYSFIVDWFVPISSLIRDATVRFQAIGLNGVSVGHTASFSVSFASGKRIHIYTRSDPSDFYLDPPIDSWLQSTGIFGSAAVPMALLQMLKLTD